MIAELYWKLKIPHSLQQKNEDVTFAAQKDHILTRTFIM